MSKLLIVESPAKAKTIGKYLGPDFVVKASMGHLRDLPRKKMSVDLEGDFTPQYEPIEGKDKIIEDLKSAAEKSEFIYLATDPDREGEAISWHLKEMLHLPDEKTKRVTFNEITKKAVLAGVEHPRDIDMNLVDAQQGRRILDRIVGYELSPFLWRKVRAGLSAGRVQSVVTRLIVDREREIKAFQPQEYWSIEVTLTSGRKSFLASFYGNGEGKVELHSQQETDQVLQAIEGQTYRVKTVKKSKKKRTPAPPFITSTLQQEASQIVYDSEAHHDGGPGALRRRGDRGPGPDRSDHLHAYRLPAGVGRRAGCGPGLHRHPVRRRLPAGQAPSLQNEEERPGRP